MLVATNHSIGVMFKIIFPVMHEVFKCKPKMKRRKRIKYIFGAENLSVSRWSHFLIAFVFLIQSKRRANQVNCLWSKAIDYHHCCSMNLGLNPFPYCLISGELHLL